MAEVFIARHPDGESILVMVMEGECISRDFRSLAKRTVDEQLNNELVQDYGFPSSNDPILSARSCNDPLHPSPNLTTNSPGPYY